MKPAPHPPAFAAAVLALLYPEPLHEAVAGDLEEEFRERAAGHGDAAASAWYWRQVARSATAALARRWRHGDAAALVVLTGFTCSLLWLVESGGRFVLSQVPLKAGEALPWSIEGIRWGTAAMVSGLGVYWWRRENRQKERSK